MPPSTPSARRRPARDDSGVVAVELVLVFPFVLMLLFLITDFGRFFTELNDTNQIAAHGARMAAVNHYPGATALRAEGDTAELRSTSGGAHLPGGVSICVDFPAGTRNVGDPVRVTASGTFQLVPLLGGTTVPLRGSATMRLEQVPTYAAGCS